MEEAFALREVDRIVAHRFGAELGDREVGRKATGNSTGLGGFCELPLERPGCRQPFSRENPE